MKLPDNQFRSYTTAGFLVLIAVGVIAIVIICFFPDVSYCIRGIARETCGDKSGATDDYDKALLFNPSNPLASFCGGLAAPLKKLSKEDLVHGEHELRKMLHDRPEMWDFVREGDPVWRWTVRQFAGEGLDCRIFWGGTPPYNPTLDECRACNRYIRSEAWGAIYIPEFGRNHAALSSEDQWSQVVFELFNIRNGSEFADLNLKAARKQLNSQNFIESIAHLEFKAASASRKFYKTIWIPNAIKHQIASNESYWNLPVDYESWIAYERTNKTAYYRNYADHYATIGRLPESIVARTEKRFISTTDYPQDSVVLQYKLDECDSWTDLGLTDAQITHAETEKTSDGAWGIEINLTPLGQTKYLYMMSELLGRRIAVFVNGSSRYGTVTVVQPFNFKIPGSFDEEQARDLSEKLNNAASQKKTSSTDTEDIKDFESSFLSKSFKTHLLSADDRAHGEKQISKMLSDRPEMAKFIKNGDPLWDWVVRQFAGEKTRTRIFWGGNFKSSSPRNYISETTFNTHDQIPYIRTLSSNRNGVAIDGEMLWCVVVYELINARRIDKFEISNQLHSTQFLRDDLLRGVERDEYDSWLDTAAFYQKVWCPHARKYNLTATEAYWRTNIPKVYNPTVWSHRFTEQHKPFEL